MSALVRLLYPLPAQSRRPAAVIGWWEGRRLRYNLIVGGAGTVALVVANLIALLPPGGRWIGLPIPPIVAFGVLANVCYSAGWALELAFNRWWKDDPPAVGPVLFRQGLIFSAGLALLPIAVASLSWIFRVVGWIAR